MIFTLFITVVLPLLIFLYCFKLKKVNVFLLGCAVFIIFQLLIRLPLLSYLVTHSLIYNQLTIQNPILFSITLALSAAVFEQVGNYIVIKLFLKHDTTWNDGILFGLGHGVIEAFLLVGIPTLMSCFSIDPINIGVLSGIERLFTIILQTGLAVLVMNAINAKKMVYLFVAILIHTFVDSLVGIIPLFVSNSVVLMEFILAIISLLLLLYVISLKKGWKIS